MATQANISSRPGNEYLDDLVWGGTWDQSSGKVSFSFANGNSTYYSAVLGQYIYNYSWSKTEKNAIKSALSDIADVANIKFAQTNSTYNANLLYFNVDSSDAGNGVLGLSDVPGAYSSASTLQTIFNNQDSSWSYLKKGGYGYATIVHEILHSVGLAHPHDTGGNSGVFPGVSGAYDTGTNGLNQQIYTIMSYIDGALTPGYWTTEAYGYAAGPMAFDIAALQYLYGENTTTARGGSAYFLPTANTSGTYWECIWDAGGNDTIKAGSTTRDVTIDLRAATLKEGSPHAGGYISKADGIYGGFTIANGVTIENAIGGRGDDKLVGNSAQNKLVGGIGNDTILGGYDNDVLSGDSGNDILDGGSGADKLDGGSGSDKLIGGRGIDTALFQTKADVSVNLGKSGYQNTGDGIDKLSSIENLISGFGDDVLFGNGRANSLLAGRGADVLRGFGNADKLDGGAGSDEIFGGSGGDRIDGGRGSDVLQGDRGADDFLFSSRFGHDTITDFQVGVDQIDLSAIRGVTRLRDIHMHQDSHGDAVADIGVNSITFEGVKWAHLSGTDFIFT